MTEFPQLVHKDLLNFFKYLTLKFYSKPIKNNRTCLTKYQKGTTESVDLLRIWDLKNI